MSHRILLSAAIVLGLPSAAAAKPTAAVEVEHNIPPKNFVALFNGQGLTGWQGLGHFSPYGLEKMTPEQRRQKQQIDNASMRAHWRVENGEIVSDSKGTYLTTNQDYGDFDLMLQFRVAPKADGGIYLRGTPQVQIWDTTEEGGRWRLGAEKGSGALWNNKLAGNRPLVHADNPIGHWNSFHIKMIGERVTVHLNGRLVVDGVPLENYWDRSKPLPERGPIQLQSFSGEIHWRNIFVRRIKRAQAAD